MCNQENFISATDGPSSFIVVDNGSTSNQDHLPKIHYSFPLFRPIKEKDAEAEMANILTAESEVNLGGKFEDSSLRYSPFSPVPLSEDELAYQIMCNQRNFRNASDRPPVMIVFDNGLTSEQEKLPKAGFSFCIFQPIEVQDSLMEMKKISGMEAEVNPDNDSDKSSQRYSGYSPVSLVSLSEVSREKNSWGISSSCPLVGKEKEEPIPSETEGKYLDRDANDVNCGFKRSQKRKRSRDEESPVGTLSARQTKRKRLNEEKLLSDTFSPAKVSNTFGETTNISDANAVADFEEHRFFTSPRWSPVDLPDDDSYEVDTENDSRKLYWTDSGEYIW